MFWVQSHKGTKPAMKKQPDTYRSSQFFGLWSPIFTALFTSKFWEVEKGNKRLAALQQDLF